MDALYSLRAVIGDGAVTNVLLGACAFQLRRAYPYVRALADHYKLTVRPLKRAHTEPGS